MSCLGKDSRKTEAQYVPVADTSETGTYWASVRYIFGVVDCYT